MNNHACTKAAEALQFAGHVFSMMWKDWPSGKACAMSGGHDTSLLWNIGHLAVSGDYFHGLMTGEPGICPEHWGALFAPGTKPTMRDADYPPLAEVQAAFQKTVQRMAA